MHRGADRGERRIAVEAEARAEHLEGHPIVGMGELRAVEIEADRLRRPVTRTLDPHEPGVPIDESLDQPRTGEAIHPGILAGCPDAPHVSGGVHPSQPAPVGPRLPERMDLQEIPLHGGKRGLRLTPGLPGIEIDLGQLLVRLPQPAHRRSPLAQAQARQQAPRLLDRLDQRAVALAAIEQPAEPVEILVRGESKLGRQREATGRPDLGLHPTEDVDACCVGRQDVHAVAQHGAAAFLQCPPDPHPDGRIARRQAEDQCAEREHLSYMYHIFVAIFTDFS